MRILFTLLVFLILTGPAHAERWIIYDMDFDVEASTVEAAPEACIKKEGPSIKTLAADCEIILDDQSEAFITWDSVDDILGTHASTDWSINIRCIAEMGDAYLATGTDPTTTDYYERDINADDESGGYGLTVTGQYACKVRVDADSAAVAAPTIKFKTRKEPGL